MSMTVGSVPKNITRETYTSLLTAAGFTIEDLQSIEFRGDGVYATVYARQDNGLKVIDPGRSGFVKHHIFVPVVDPDRTDQVQTTQGAAA